MVRQNRHALIVIVYDATFLRQKLHKSKRRTFPQIRNIALVRNTNNQEPSLSQSAHAARVQNPLKPFNYAPRRLCIQIARKLDQRRTGADSTCCLQKIVRVHRDAVPANAGARIERHEAERLSRRARLYFPDVESQRNLADHRV